MDVSKAVSAHFEAKKAEALVRYLLYTNNIVGIGDHSNIVEEAIKAIEDYEHAESCLEALSKVQLMKLIAAIKKFFSRKKKKKEKALASLKFEVDSAGDIWIDCSWQDQPAANIIFADLMYKVMDGDLFGETLAFIKEECEKRNRLDNFIEIWAYLHTMEQEVEEEVVEDYTVVSPTKMLDIYKPKITPDDEHFM